MKRGRTWGVAAGLVLVALLPVGAFAQSATEPPTLCSKSLKPCGEPVVLGQPEWETGKVTVYGYSSKVGPCIGSGSDGLYFVSCGGNQQPQGGDPISIDGLGVLSGQHPYTELSGILRRDVTGVRLRWRADGRTNHLSAFVAQINGDTQQALKAPKPFGIFEAQVPGCVDGSHFFATTFDEDGKRLGTTRQYDFKGSCRDIDPSDIVTSDAGQTRLRVVR